MRALLVVANLGMLVACGSRTAAPVADPPVTPPAAKGIDVAGGHATRAEDVVFTVEGRQVPGTVVAPTAPGPWPAVVLLAGSGPTDRDWNSPLIATRNGSGKLLAEALATHGAVVLRFDKVGTGGNTALPPARWTLDTYRDEAAGALAFVRARADVRGDRVFVAGHSEGGIHATRLAAIASPPVAGVLYLASASRTMTDTILAQLEAQLRNPMAMLSDRAVELELDGLRAAFSAFAAGQPVDPQRASKIPALQQLVAQLIAPATAALTRALIAFDNAAEAAKLPGPFFVLAGGKDIQVDVDRDARRLERTLREAGRDVTFHLAPDADHVLKHEPRAVAEIRADLVATQRGYNAEGRTLDADAVRAIVGWLAAQTNAGG